VAALSLVAAQVIGLPAEMSALAASGPELLPGIGQFVSTPITRVVDTRFGNGGVPKQPLGANQTLTFPVAGVFGVPSDADSVVLDVTALDPTAAGYLTIYNTDDGDPGVASAGMRTNHMTNQTATVEVSSTGTVSLTNHSSGSTDLVASIVGYYTGPVDAPG
jgi:hypothetical protein